VFDDQSPLKFAVVGFDNKKFCWLPSVCNFCSEQETSPVDARIA